MRPFVPKFRIVNGSAFDATTMILVLMLDELADDPDEPHSTVFLVQGGTARNLAKHLYNVVSTTFGPGGRDDAWGLGQWGQAVRYLGGGAIEETQLPVPRGPMRAITCAGDTLFAVGTALQAFRKRPSGDWEDISVGGTLFEDYDENILEAVAGFAPDEVYAAGSEGIVWWFDGQAWTPIQCMTNAAFHAVTCAEDGVVYLCGQSGIIAKGRRDAFEVLDTEDDLIDLWGIALYDDTLYAAGFTMLLEMVDDVLEIEEIASDMADHFYDIVACDGVLWSFGMSDILRLDGDEWQRLIEVTVEDGG
ncbi:hypothetical protein [Puniceibacterium sp. IMCC21224]|uniref:hypothetical protein n=1 Tax=Puniceibacterium sp. IMCC21224 TaxID=1618204 RepID=UPI00064E1521|nr:hypothetical protein [Puniceibacterium sp. IMCC21224]KMK65246.1 hypothetical protein IMCC21224_1176 [Puniceibacterium sp. IMCC21224]